MFKALRALVPHREPGLSPAAVESVRYDYSHWDQFYSGQLGLGGSRDKARMFTFAADARLADQVRDSMYRSSGLVGRIIDLPAQDMLRAGFDILDDLSELLQDELEAQEAAIIFDEALKTERLQGGSVIPLDVDDGQDLTEPVRPESIKRVQMGLFGPVVEKRYCQPENYISGIRPEIYRVNAGGNLVSMHRSRLLIFPGIYAGQQNRDTNMGWGESILDLIYEALRNFTVDHNAASTLVKDFNQPVFTLKNFSALGKGSAQDQAKAAIDKLKVMNLMRSIVNAFIMEEGDTFTRNSATVTGLRELIELSKLFLSSCVGIPHTRLFNESPGGSLGESGASQARDWYDTVAYLQKIKLAPVLKQLLFYMACAQGQRRQIRFNFNPLWQPTGKEAAEIRKLTAEADEIEIRSGVLKPSWIRSSRYGGGADYAAHVVVPTDEMGWEKPIEPKPNTVSLPAALPVGTNGQPVTPTTDAAYILKRCTDAESEGVYDVRV